MANHLIIGLGGTGGQILCGLRKRIYAESGKKNISGDTNLEYLYVDSCTDDLDNKSKWTYMGEPLHLAPSQKVCINGMAANVMQNLHAYPGIQAFLTDSDRIQLMNDQVQSIISTGIGGQRRRFGRMLIANNIGTHDMQNSFTSRLRELIDQLIHKGNGELDFHVCAGLAGGTGSGSIIDVIAQIRNITAPMGHNFRLFLYLYIPEILVPEDHNSGFYHANGYAALTELNALSLNVYHPTDVTGNIDYQTQKVARLLKNCDAFTKAYLFSNFNEVNQVLPKSEKLPEAVADFIYQRTVVPGMTGTSGEMQRLINAENNGNAPEKDEAGINVHSREFMTFGIKRIEYPENEIKEYVSLKYAEQTAKQLAYNHWVDTRGYDTLSLDEVGLGYHALFTTTNQGELETLKISDKYLTLQTAIKEIKGVTENWQEYYSYWETLTQFFGENVMENCEKENWISRFNENCEMEWKHNFRNNGVVGFFASQQKDNVGNAASLRRDIETKLYNEWLAGSKSLLEVEKYIQLLIAVNQDRLQQFDNRIADINNYVKNNTLPDIESIKKEWDNIKWIKDVLTGASKKIFQQYQSAKCELYTAKTEIESFKYAKTLLMKLQEQLTMILKGVTAFKESTDKILRNVIDSAEEKCSVKTEHNVQEAQVLDKKYNPQAIRDMAASLTKDREKQKSCAEEVRQVLTNKLGEDERTFGNLASNIGNYNELTREIVKVCETHAKQALQGLAEQDETQRVLNVNILEKIRQEYPTDDALEQYIHTIIKQAANFMQFNEAEKGKVIANQHALGMNRMIQLCLPEYNDATNFRDKFIHKFQEQCPGFNPVDCVALNPRSSQIVVVSASCSFPLRYINNLRFLEEQYKAKTHDSEADLNKVLLHTESFTQELPELFEENHADKRIKLLPYSIILHSLGILTDKTDPETGATFKAFSIGSGFNRKWIHTGKQMEETTKMLVQDARLAKTVSDYIDNVLKTEYKLNSKKEELRTSIESTVCDTILPLCNDNDLDPLFVEYRKAAEKLFEGKLADK